MTGFNKVLVVDDEQAMRDLVSRYLTNAGFEAITAATVEEAKWKLREHEDMRTAVVDGRIEPNSPSDAYDTGPLISWLVPRLGGSVICFTGNDDSIVHMEMKSDGCVDVVIKPDIHGLVASVTRHAQSPRGGGQGYSS